MTLGPEIPAHTSSARFRGRKAPAPEPRPVAEAVSLQLFAKDGAVRAAAVRALGLLGSVYEGTHRDLYMGSLNSVVP